jgi:hypothetical protein
MLNKRHLREAAVGLDEEVAFLYGVTANCFIFRGTHQNVHHLNGGTLRYQFFY